LNLKGGFFAKIVGYESLWKKYKEQYQDDGILSTPRAPLQKIETDSSKFCHIVL
jgi:hypothetical protein